MLSLGVHSSRNGHKDMEVLQREKVNHKCVEGSLWEKRFEVYCIKNNIPIWSPVVNQTHEDYLIKILDEIVPVNVKYRGLNSRNRFEMKLTSRRINYLTDTDIRYIALGIDKLPEVFFFIDLNTLRNSEKIHSKYPSISLSMSTLFQYSTFCSGS